jgi:hypothetical protein
VNYGKQFYINTGTTTLNYSCYSNGPNDVYTIWGGALAASNNNIETDPLFADRLHGDFRLFGSSPCINSGHNGYVSTEADIRGQARIQSTTVDMGVYEWTAGVDPGGTAFIWTGAVSADWNTPGNWSTLTVPSASDDVIIPDTPNDPVVNEAPATPAVCRDITVGQGVVVTILPGKALMVNGSMTINAGTAAVTFR